MAIDWNVVARFLQIFEQDLMSRSAPHPDVPRDDVARYYRHFYKNPRSRAMRIFQYRRRLENGLPAVDPRHGRRILDAGCGVGTSSLLFAALGATVVGVDSSQAYIGAAKSRIARYEEWLERELDVSFLEGSVLRLDEPVASFDAIWVMEAISHIYPPEEFLHLAGTLLKPGGKLVVSDANPTWIQRRRVQGKQKGKEFFYVALSNGERMPYGNENIIAPRELSELARAGGMEPLFVRYSHCLPSDLARFLGARLIKCAESVAARLPVVRRLAGVYTTAFERSTSAESTA